jgi:hypothetical protein
MFVEYAFDRSPERALLAFYYATTLHRERDREILLSEHIINNAIWLGENGFDERYNKSLPEAQQNLEKLAKHKEWWVRLYVAEIMRQHRELRQDEVIRTLSKDSDPIVAKITKSYGQ